MYCIRNVLLLFRNLYAERSPPVLRGKSGERERICGRMGVRPVGSPRIHRKALLPRLVDRMHDSGLFPTQDPDTRTLQIHFTATPGLQRMNSFVSLTFVSFLGLPCHPVFVNSPNGFPSRKLLHLGLVSDI